MCRTMKTISVCIAGLFLAVLLMVGCFGLSERGKVGEVTHDDFVDICLYSQVTQTKYSKIQYIEEVTVIYDNFALIITHREEVKGMHPEDWWFCIKEDDLTIFLNDLSPSSLDKLKELFKKHNQ